MNTQVSTVDEEKASQGASKVDYSWNYEAKKQNPIVLTLIDLFMICAPLMFLFGIMLLEGHGAKIMNKPEWSFVTVFLLIEVIRDQATRGETQKLHVKHLEAANVFYLLFLVGAVLVMGADYRFSIDRGAIDSGLMYELRIGYFKFAVTVFVAHRFYRRFQEAKIERYGSLENAAEAQRRSCLANVINKIRDKICGESKAQS